MKKTNSLKRITNLIAVMVILLGVIPFTAANITTVYADGEETTEPAETVTETTPVEEVSSAPEVKETASTEEPEAEGDETAPAEAAETEGEAVEETDADTAEETEDVLEEAVVAETEKEILPEASEAAVEETVETEADVDVSEIVEALSEADVQIVDESGEALPLASVEAVEVLAYSDPFLWDDNLGKWVGFADSVNGCPANVICNASATPFQAAVEYSELTGMGNVIYVAGGEYKENVVVNTVGLSFTAFQTITVPDTNVVPVYTSGYALVNKITINVELGTIEGVYAKEVIVNDHLQSPKPVDGRLDDAMVLVNDGGTIEADMILYRNNVNNDPQNPDGSNYPSGQLRVKDVNDANINFEWECGEPNKKISVNTVYRMVLKDPSHKDILDYYIAHGDERSSNNYLTAPLPAEDQLEDLVIGVNLAEEIEWKDKDEERVFWYLLGNSGEDVYGNNINLKNSPYSGSQQEKADEITRGDHDSIVKTHSIWFLWPKAKKGVENVSPDNTQLTFFGYETREVDGCMDPEAENYDPNATIDNEDCVYPTIPPVTPPATTTTTAELAVPIEFIIPVTGQFPLITAGIGHTCALTAKEGLECWGLNESGQVGDSTFDDTLVPVDVVGIDPTTVTGLVSGIHHTCVLTSANDVYCWGLNSSGQLGDGTTENRNEPILVDGLEGKITSISAGAEFTCALNDANDVFCWGNNSSGQLNDGTEDHSSLPVKTTTVSSDTVLISGGSLELQGITSDGAMQLWNSQPVIPVTGLPEDDNAFVSADRFTEGGCTMTDAGDVNCWGGITDAQVKGAVVNDMLSSGKGHACTMKPEGLVCWGSNSNGQLGDDSLDDSLEETLVIKLEQGVIALAAGMKHTCVIYTDETIACWGLNDYGQLGNDTIDDSMVPVNTK